MGNVLTEEATSLLAYPAGRGVVKACLDRQALAHPRSGVARLFGVSPVHPEARSWFGGALGEIRVGELLDKLGPEWSVIHSVPVGTRGSDIDHVLVGPAGVFTLNTKRHPGAKIWLAERMLMVAGHKTDYLRNSLHEAQRASKLLTTAVGDPVEVKPIIVLVDAGPITVKRRPMDVVVVTDTQLVGWLSKRRRVLSDEHVRMRADAAARVRTWHKSEQVVVDAGQAPRFAALQREESQASTRRMLWVGVLAISGVVAASAMLGNELQVLLGL